MLQQAEESPWAPHSCILVGGVWFFVSPVFFFFPKQTLGRGREEEVGNRRSKELGIWQTF